MSHENTNTDVGLWLFFMKTVVIAVGHFVRKDVKPTEKREFVQKQKSAAKPIKNIVLIYTNYLLYFQSMPCKVSKSKSALPFNTDAHYG